MHTFVKELWGYLRAHKKLWLAPILTIVVVIGALLLIAQTSVLAPFIYALF